ncbi:MAG: hypothetical protein IT258_12570 [Saprospiraceae bacterium]|nr:hypothetical protein [Saprospiraceae bacterium]
MDEFWCGGAVVLWLVLKCDAQTLGLLWLISFEKEITKKINLKQEFEPLKAGCTNTYRTLWRFASQSKGLATFAAGQSFILAA